MIHRWDSRFCLIFGPCELQVATCVTGFVPVPENWKYNQQPYGAETLFWIGANQEHRAFTRHPNL